MKLSRRRVTWECVRHSDVSFIKIPETCVCNSDLFSASPFSSARLKGNFGPFLSFYYLFSFFFIGAVEKRVWKFLRERSSSIEILISRILSFVGRLLTDIDFLKRKIWKSSFFFYFFLYASCKRQFISIDWFRISAKEVHPHSLLYGSSRPSANATNCCKQPSST